MTKKNPFNYQHIKDLEFLKNPKLRISEPFCGDWDLIQHLRNIGVKNDIDKYDINPTIFGTIYNDSFLSIKKTDIIATNPPWLSVATATKKGLKVDFKGYSNLWRLSLKNILDAADYALVLLPRMFLRSNFMFERLISVTWLPSDLFIDTTFPCCLAVFGKDKTADFEIYKQSNYIGMYSVLKGLFNAMFPEIDKELKLEHHVKEGNLGFKSLRALPIFCNPAEIEYKDNNYTSNYLLKVNRKIGAAEVALLNVKIADIKKNDLDIFLDNYTSKNHLRIRLDLVKKIISSVLDQNRITFQHHVPDGNIGFKSIVESKDPFYLPSELPEWANKKNSSFYLIKVNRKVGAKEIALLNHRIKELKEHNVDVFIDQFYRKNCLKIDFGLVKKIISSVLK